MKKKRKYFYLGDVNLTFNTKTYETKDNVIYATITSTLHVDDLVSKEFVTTAFAKCSPEDKFDERIGQKISAARAENKAYELAENFLKKLSSKYVKLAAACDERANMLHEYAWRNRWFVNKIGHGLKYDDAF